MGSANDGAVSSKIGALRGYVENPVVQISFNNLSLADAIRFVSATANLQVLMSNEVEDSEQRVTLNVEAGVLSIIDALLNQYEVSILYDQDLEVAQFYTDTEFQTRLARVRQAVEGYNTNLYETRETAKLKQQRDLLNELIAVARAIIYDYETEQAASYSTSDVDRLITSIPQNDDLFSKAIILKSVRLKPFNVIKNAWSVLSALCNPCFQVMPRPLSMKLISWIAAPAVKSSQLL